jgi:hypothetical protein
MNRDLKQIAQSLREGPEVQPGVMWFSRELAIDLANVCEQADAELARLRAELAKAEACSTDLSQRVAQEQIHSNKTADDLFAIRRGEAPSDGASELIKEIHADYVAARRAQAQLKRFEGCAARDDSFTPVRKAIMAILRDSPDYPLEENEFSDLPTAEANAACATIINAAMDMVVEIDRLREFEARESVVTNVMAAFVAFQDDKMSPEAFQDLITRSEKVMCSAIEALGRRDKIRKLEGAHEEADRMIRNLRESANIAAARGYHDTAIRHTYDADQLTERLTAIKQQLTQARAGK